MNVPRRHESVATDTIILDTAAVDSGVKQAQVFVRRDSLVADVYHKKSAKQICEHTGGQHQKKGSYGQIDE